MFRLNTSEVNWQNFISARNRCKAVLNKAKSNYSKLTRSKIESQKLGSRDFWKIFNSSYRKGRSTVPPLFVGAQVLTSSQDKAEVFGQSFSTNCSLSSLNHPIPNFPPRCSDTVSDIRVTPHSVARIISSLRNSIASGPDHIPVIVLKMCSPELSPVLSKLFNKCLSESSFPICWKCASVVPIFKNSGERSQPGNYRPISLLPIISKIFESVIKSVIVNHLESQNLLSDKQYGFRSSRSTADLLTVITEKIYRALDNCGEARVVALDISKAFDRVWHAGLLQKLASHGISGNILKIIKSFLQDRAMTVSLDGEISSTYPITAGVSQGSILGPILFLAYINDLSDNMICDLAMFADDSSLYSYTDCKSTINTSQNLTDCLDLDLSKVSSWGDRWLVKFNSAKTNLLSVNRYKKSLQFPRFLFPFCPR